MSRLPAWIAEQLPGSRSHEIEVGAERTQAGHFLQEEVPDAIVDVVGRARWTGEP